MARPSTRNPLDCFLRRQIDDRTNHCKRLVSARIDDSENLFRKDLLSHYGCVNAIEFSPQGDLLISGGDDRRVLLWKVEQAIQGVGKPMPMRAQHGSNIFCLGYDSGKTKIFSAGNDDQVIIHNLENGAPLNFFLHEKPVYGLSTHPHNDNVFSSACDDGRVLIFDIRDSSSTETFCLAQYKTAFHSVVFNPMEPRTLATANAQEGISLWDVRKPMTPVLRYGSEGPSQGCMNVRFNSAGTRLLALRRRLPPVLYAVDSPTHLCHFDQPGYYNSCTMKSCCFAGDDDEYVLSGSDDFNLYMWKIPSEEIKWVDSAHMILRGHRSIVNQVRYNRASCILASSGVEKIIKIWSPFPLCNSCLGSLKRDSGKQERQRRVFTHDEYIELVLRSGEFMTHDYSHQSTLEDPRMMAFFDSLVQREIEGWGSEDTPNSPRSISETKNTLNPGQTQNFATDSDGATTRNSTRTGSGGGLAPERSVDSPNRITRLIGNRREKLMRLAAIEAGAQVVNLSSNSANNDEESDPQEREIGSDENEEDDDEVLPAKFKSKSKSRSKGLKRKQRAASATMLTADSDHGESSKSSENEEAVRNKRKRGRNEGEASSSRIHRRQQGKLRTRKSATTSGEQQTNTETSSNHIDEVVNGFTEESAACTATPSKILSSNKISPPTPDSGITSCSSTLEKCESNGSSGARNAAENSDHEMRVKHLETFKKKIDVARRGYRKRLTPQAKIAASTASDSSD
ncbi:DDB1- and CUL4-associated factor 5 isoform X2 [Venturia canescens]|uniref:DDB1- and CUL4-associated factor 5 isoform X2 n=1 Tax=Venturia canescens TaxID=32260 RepID=UPI001C9CA0A5|nr:DDB1- and CUL4-associated factor 5 isoform X2 [Venturia canescens]